jgi:hypothetical protein
MDLVQIPDEPNPSFFLTNRPALLQHAKAIALVITEAPRLLAVLEGIATADNYKLSGGMRMPLVDRTQQNMWSVLLEMYLWSIRAYLWS